MARHSKTELYAAIRRDVRDGLSIGAVMRKHGVSHPTVRQALDSAWPKPRKKMEPRASLLDPFKPVIDAMLRADLNAPRKQRHTVKRIFDRLVDEHDAPVSYGIVRRYVAERRPQIRVEAGRGSVEAFISQTHRPGAEAELDFGDVTVRIRGQQVTCYQFSLRLSYSGKAVHRVFMSGGQEAFFEGHVHASEVSGGVPFGKIRYDNLKPAVAQILGFTRQRVETERWMAFRSHYGIESFYRRPGIGGRPREGRGGRADRLVSPQPLCPGARGRLAGRA
ncbi:IS21 family transposase [Actinomadura decatromicini]|uniref:IS21 family transposase n=1 Tax=Actinomadura decatromicini TaxID=2604572 RepID=UPI001CA37371|nr:IS21 family transposase [Actinomadura decatromicini]